MNSNMKNRLIDYHYKRETIPRIGIILLCCSFVLNIYISVAVSSIIILVCLFLFKRRLNVDHEDFMLFFGMLLWQIFGGYGLKEGLIFGIGFVIVYESGKITGNNTYKDGFEITEQVVIITALLMFIRGVIHYSYFLGDIEGKSFESWPDITGTMVPRTQHEFYLVMIASLIGYFIFALIKKRYIFGASIIMSLAAIAMGLLSQGRMTFFCAVGSGMVIIVAYVFEKKLYRTTVFIITTMIIVIAMLCIVVCYDNNIFGLHDRYLESIWVGSGGVLHNTRFTLMADTFRMMKDYPFGKNDTLLVEYNGATTPYAHNTWLDIGKRGGIIPFALILGFSISNIISTVFLWAKSYNYKKYAVISAFIGVTLYNMFEPAIEANLLFWGVEVFLGGLLRGLFVNLQMEGKDRYAVQKSSETV